MGFSTTAFLLGPKFHPRRLNPGEVHGLFPESLPYDSGRESYLAEVLGLWGPDFLGPTQNKTLAIA
jgi:hypothetical protein